MSNKGCAMRSPRAEAVRASARAAACVALAWGAASAASADMAAASAPAIGASATAAPAATPEERAARIDAVVRQLRVDPLISGQHKEHELQWKKDEEQKPKKTAKPEPESNWFKSFLEFLNDTSRFLFWGGAAVLVAVLLVSARHLVQLQGLRRRAALPSVVSHVRDLDVRPESLPDDVGAAAWALWQAGQAPAALSLLYRGALSRLIHRHRVAITSSATEGECLDLARGRLEAGALRYVTQVVRAREASTYGGRALSAAMGEALCSGFATRLDAAPAAGPDGAA
jgi:hypothetical protein